MLCKTTVHYTLYTPSTPSTPSVMITITYMITVKESG